MEWKSPSFLRALGRSVALKKSKRITTYKSNASIHTKYFLMRKNIYIYNIYIYLYKPICHIRILLQLLGIPLELRFAWVERLLLLWCHQSRNSRSDAISSLVEANSPASKPPSFWHGNSWKFWGPQGTLKRFQLLRSDYKKWNTSDVPVNVIYVNRFFTNTFFHNKTRMIRGLSMSYLTYLSNLNKCLNIYIYI